MKSTIVPLLLAVICVSASARAQTSVYRRGGVDGKNEISTQLGFQASLGATTPGGVKLFFDYSRKMSDLVWLNFKLNPTFGSGSTRVYCYDNNGDPYDCGSALSDDGDAIDFLAGVKFKFPIRSLPALVPYGNLNAGVVAIFGRPLNDGGAAIVLRTGGGIKYFVTPHVGLGGEFNFGFGPAFYSRCDRCREAHNEFYRAFDMGIGAEFIF
jgi:hypothetical protein